ncbi:zinc finger protein 681-like [Anthonomus grandis grandis]|uniref:zinc finger protein 681-like n=1 Tax=Anthonomus grandis grandis TaxID=2921223 RepID=UPI0021652E3C|nr:zinc finger protein 681-like [Anthonomus grandis grandis]
MYLSTSSCTLCKEHITSKVKYNLKTSTAEKSNKPLLNFVEVFNKNIIFSHCNICANCYKLINELDVLQQREKEILAILKRYVCSKEGNSDNSVETTSEAETNTVYVKEEIQLPDVDLKNLPIKIKRVPPKQEHTSSDYDMNNICDFDEYLCDSLLTNTATDNGNDAFERIQNSIKEDLFRHAAEQQNKTKPSSALCEICGQNFKSKNGYENHMKKHNSADDDFKLLTLNKGEEEDYQCPICGKEFNQKISKKRHMAIHTGETRYQCEHCGKKFIHHSSFNMHMKIHAGVRNYKCTLCHREFLNSSHLKRHVRSLHIGEKRYACDICGKKFGERYNLEAHIRVLHKEIEEEPMENYVEEEVTAVNEMPNVKTESATVIYQLQDDGTFLGGVTLLKNDAELVNSVVVSDPNILYSL